MLAYTSLLHVVHLCWSCRSSVGGGHGGGESSEGSDWTGHPVHSQHGGGPAAQLFRTPPWGKPPAGLPPARSLTGMTPPPWLTWRTPEHLWLPPGKKQTIRFELNSQTSKSRSAVSRIPETKWCQWGAHSSLPNRPVCEASTKDLPVDSDAQDSV